MIAYTSDGPIRFESFTFPDGQPHVKVLDALNDPDAELTVETSIQTPDDLFRLQLLSDALNTRAYSSVLNIRYLMGARMDRAIDAESPFTLRIVAQTIRGCGFLKVRVLDPHSQASLDHLGAVAVSPKPVVQAILAQYDPADTIILCPDKGAEYRTRELVQPSVHHFKWRVMQALKHRDPQTGKLLNFEIPDAADAKDKRVLIVDDICDGGGTFSAEATILKDAGAASVDLYVTHGIFSKGLPIRGIDRVFTTNSYRRPAPSLQKVIDHPMGLSDVNAIYPVRMRDL